MELGAFARTLLAATYAHIVTLEDPTGELDVERVFSDAERDRANRAFSDLKFVVVYSFLFIKLAEGELRSDIRAFTECLTLALCLALKDNGSSDGEITTAANRITEGFVGRYAHLLDKHEKAGTRTGLDFLVCQAFADSTLPLDLTSERDMEKHFVLFSMAKNLLKLTYAYADEQWGNVRVICTA